MKNKVNMVRVSGLRTNNYAICRQTYYKDMQECIKDTKRIYSMMTRLIKKNNKYEYISFVVGASQTRGDTARKVKEKTKGRPKYVVYGENVKPHLHIAVYGLFAPSFCSEIRKELNKNIYKTKKDYINRGYKHKMLYTLKKLNQDTNGLYYIPYIWQQSEAFLSHGKLNFEELKKADFIAFEETEL